VVDSREKGSRAELLVKKELIRLTGLGFQRVPGSGALAPVHGLKADIYVPNEKNLYAIEVKHYKEDHLTSSIITGKNPQVLEWWKQAVRQGEQTGKKPLLIFKFDRSKIFVGFESIVTGTYRYITISVDDYLLNVALLEDWVTNEKPEFIK
jgi:Holliday junction resolvase